MCEVGGRKSPGAKYVTSKSIFECAWLGLFCCMYTLCVSIVLDFYDCFCVQFCGFVTCWQNDWELEKEVFLENSTYCPVSSN